MSPAGYMGHMSRGGAIRVKANQGPIWSQKGAPENVHREGASVDCKGHGEEWSREGCGRFGRERSDVGSCERVLGEEGTTLGCENLGGW